MLKSGCKVEHLGHRRGERIERSVPINAVIAWRLAAMTLLGRETPELPATVPYSDIEILGWNDFATERHLPTPDNFGRAVVTMAVLDGYLNRRKEPSPCHQKLWHGYTLLANAAPTYARLLRMKETSELHQRMYPD